MRTQSKTKTRQRDRQSNMARQCNARRDKPARGIAAAAAVVVALCVLVVDKCAEVTRDGTGRRGEEGREGSGSFDHLILEAYMAAARAAAAVLAGEWNGAGCDLILTVLFSSGCWI